MAVNLPKVATDEGSAMSALNPQQQAFVVALFEQGSDNATEAARKAGYGAGDNPNSIRSIAWRFLTMPKIQRAIQEYAKSRMVSLAPAMIRHLEEIAINPQHKDQVKAVLAMMNRAGLHEVVERNVNVNITMSNAEKIEKIRLLAEKHHIPVDGILGTITDAEYTELPPQIPEGEEY